MALARSIPALVVAAIERVPHLALQGLLDDQPGRQLDQLRAAGRRREPSFNQGREGFTGAHRGRYPRPHGVLLWAWAGSAEPGLIIHPKDAPHPEFPATLGLHPRRRLYEALDAASPPRSSADRGIEGPKERSRAHLSCGDADTEGLAVMSEIASAGATRSDGGSRRTALAASPPQSTGTRRSGHAHDPGPR